LQEITTGFRADYKKKAVFNFLIQPRYAANRAKGVIVSGFALKVQCIGLGGNSHRVSPV
jgi:hypothetical protein